MAFRSYVYEAKDGASSFYIKIDTDQAGLSGALIGTPTQGFHVVVSRSKRSYGLKPRFISLSREEGVAQDGTGKVHTTRLAICTQAAFDAIALNAGVSINGIDFKVASKTDETLR
jgi:hypothetical protein